MFDIHLFFDWLNNYILALPSIILFLAVTTFLTIQTKFIQIRGLPRFFKLVFGGIKEMKKQGKETINPFHALFAAMATTIGMGNVVSPSLAIMIGGPGALFWLISYILFGSVTKYVEVSYALDTRAYLDDGFVLGGPIQYLRTVGNWLANWYGYLIIFVVLSWSSGQANTLANIMVLEGVPKWVVGLALASFVFLAMSGGAKRVGEFASKLVPIMFVLYVTFALSILLQNIPALISATRLVFQNAFNPSAAVGGFLGASVLQAVREGMFRGIFVTESGLGTSSIPHSLADTKNPTDQGILAMGSVLADAFLSILSGMLVLVTGIWSLGAFRSTLIYEVFKLQAPGIGQYVLLFSVTLFVLTTAMGNTLNGMQSFGILVKDNRFYMNCYMALTVSMIFAGALVPMKLLWDIIDMLVLFIAVPNLIGITLLAYRRPEVLRLK